MSGVTEPMSATATRREPILICYDGSPDAVRAIEAAAALLGPRRAVVVDVLPWMTPAESLAATSSLVRGNDFEALNSAEARRIASRGAEIARSAGFHAEPRGELASSTCEGIVDVADELDARRDRDRLEGPDGREEDLRRQPLAAGRRARRPAGADRGAATLMAVGRHAVRRLPPEPNPALVRHGQERAQSVQNRIADRITAFAGSMTFVYIHIAWFGCWIGFGVEDYPYGLLTMIVSLEAIFLSTFVMISQNRADAKRQLIADQQWQTVQEEDRQNQELLALSRQILDLLRSQIDRAPRRHGRRPDGETPG